MAKEDYYQTLGVSRETNAADIKRAYRRLAMKHHPDRNAGDSSAEEKFKEIQEAYDVLSNEKNAPLMTALATPPLTAWAAAVAVMAVIFPPFLKICSAIFSAAARGDNKRAKTARAGFKIKF